MITFIIYIILVALLAAFGVLLMKKIKLVETIQKHGNDFFSEMFRCDFCLSWWACFLICLIMSICFNDYRYITIAFFSTPLTRILL